MSASLTWCAHARPTSVLADVCNDAVQVYVLGSDAYMVRRPSLQLPVESRDVRAEESGLQSMARISSYHSQTQSGRIVDPPPWFVQGLAEELHVRLGVSLFNFDLICPTQQPQFWLRRQCRFAAGCLMSHRVCAAHGMRWQHIKGFVHAWQLFCS